MVQNRSFVGLNELATNQVSVKKDGQRFVTDMQNFIIDLALDVIEDPIAFGKELDHVVGVVEHGLFNQMVDKVIVAGRDGVQILTSTKANQHNKET